MFCVPRFDPTSGPSRVNHARATSTTATGTASTNTVGTDHLAADVHGNALAVNGVRALDRESSG